MTATRLNSPVATLRLRNSEPAKSQSLWVATGEMPKYSPLQGNIDTEICVVGGGIAGLTTAYLLAQAGKSVVVIEDGELASGVSSVTTAHLSNALDDRYFEIERLHGVRGARLAAESHSAAIDQIEAIAKKEKIDCDFERLDGYLFASNDREEDMLDREFDAATRTGLAVRKMRRVPIGALDVPCLRFPDQGQFHPLKYLAGVAKAIERAGGRIFTHTHVDAIKGGPHTEVTAGAYVVTAESVVVATNTPINDRLVIHTKQAPYMTYVIGATVPPGSVEKALYWDTEDPYHYVRLHSVTRDRETDHDILIVGGEDHKTGQADDTDERHARLEQWARARFPHMEQVEFTWAGQVMETIDGLAFIGRNPMDEDNVYVVTGDSGMGMTHGTIAGILLTDLIRGRENPWSTLYDPSRKTLRAAGEFAKEAVNMTAQYADWVTGGDVQTVDEIARESGAVVRRGLTKVAVYRDENDKLHELSAVCTHLGCIVHWNIPEKTWDCPCHGSRFDKLGKVVSGPANSDLTPIQDK